MGQLKTGKLYLTEQVKNLDFPKDAFFIQQGYEVEYFLENGASKNVLAEMKKYGIKYTIGKKIK